MSGEGGKALFTRSVHVVRGAGPPSGWIGSQSSNEEGQMRKPLVRTMIALHLGLLGAAAAAAPSAHSLTTQSVAATLNDEGLHLEGLTPTANGDGRRSFGPSVPSDVMNVYVVEAGEGATQFVLVRYVPINAPASRDGTKPPTFDVIARIARLADPSWSNAADDLFKGSLQAWRVGEQVTIRREAAVVQLAGSPPDLMYFLIVVAGACDIPAVLNATTACDVAER